MKTISTAANTNPAQSAINSTDVDVSIVIPVQNEEDNIGPLCAELQAMMKDSTWSYQVIFVNDGSKDRTAQELEKVVAQDPRFTVIEFARRFGQSAALAAGFEFARGKVIVPMDGDLQNDPADVPRLVAMLDEPPGYDIISGWRKARQDHWLSRNLPSRIANAVIRKATYCQAIHDFGCTLKAYRQEALSDVRLYGEMHRFLPALCRWRGARLGEKVVNHRARLAGETKYGLKRTIKVLFDLLTVKFLGDYLTKPIYFFGKISLFTLMISFTAIGIAVVQKFGYITETGRPLTLNNNVLTLFSTMMFITTVLLLMMGVIAELLVRIYHESQGRTPYKIRRICRAAPVRDDSDAKCVGQVASKAASQFPGTRPSTNVNADCEAAPATPHPSF
jgi:glycosyltransferase involved in cell wall biosynthesis